jgi:hypothetical protein
VLQKCLVASCLLLTCLTGCGTAYVMREDAGKVAEVAASTTVLARQRYEEIAAKQMDFFLDQLANDGNCRPVTPVLVELQQAGVSPPLRCLTQSEILAWNNCKNDSSPPVCSKNKRIERLSLGDLGAGRQSALTLIEIISDYQVVLANIVAGEKIDTKADIESLEQRLAKLCSAFNVAECTKVPAADSTDEQEKRMAVQIDAAVGLIQIFREMKSDQDALIALRRLLSQTDANAPVVQFESALGALAARYGSVELGLETALEQRRIAMATQSVIVDMCRDAGAGPDPCAQSAINSWLAKPLKYRKDRFREVYEARRELAIQRSVPDPLAATFAKLRAIHVDLKEAVVNRNYSADQRKRIADRNFSQLKSIFTATKGLVSAFGIL